MEGAPSWGVPAGTSGDCRRCEGASHEEGEDGKGEVGEMHDAWSLDSVSGVQSTCNQGMGMIRPIEKCCTWKIVSCRTSITFVLHCSKEDVV